MTIRPAVSLPALFLALALFGHTHIACAQTSPATSASSHTVLVELFTSEGCSSCPPADTLLQQINGRRLPSGELVVGISEHVTYWNHLGWSDPFSSDRFTERQTAYSDHFGAGSVYTPQAVVNGTREAVGSDRAAVLQAIHAAAAETPASGTTLQIRSATVSGDQVVVTYTATVTGRVPDNAGIYAVVADDLRRSRVARGENTGRTLSHVAVARSLMHISALRSGDSLTAHIPLPPAGDSPTRHVILFAQANGPGRVLAIDSHAVEGLSSGNTAAAHALAVPLGP